MHISCCGAMKLSWRMNWIASISMSTAIAAKTHFYSINPVKLCAKGKINGHQIIMKHTCERGDIFHHFVSFVLHSLSLEMYFQIRWRSRLYLNALRFFPFGSRMQNENEILDSVVSISIETGMHIYDLIQWLFSSATWTCLRLMKVSRWI